MALFTPRGLKVRLPTAYADTVQQFKDDGGDIYAITAFKEGTPRVAVIKKEIWERGRAAF